jgi:hypothetical protein
MIARRVAALAVTLLVAGAVEALDVSVDVVGVTEIGR